MSATEGERSEEQERQQHSIEENVEIENDGENLDSPSGVGGEFLRGSEGDPPLLLRLTIRQHGGGVVGVEREGGLTDSATAIPTEGQYREVKMESGVKINFGRTFCLLQK